MVSEPFPEAEPAMSDIQPGAEARQRPTISLLRVLPLVAILLAALAAYWLWGDLLSFEALRENRDALLRWRDNNFVLAAAIYMGTYVAVVALSLPGAFVMTVAGGFLFGLLPGVPLVVLSATLGATCIFLAARFGLGDVLYARLKGGERGFLQRVERGLSANRVSYLLLMRLVPAVPFVIANLAPAFLGVPLRVFFLTTVFGILPGTLVTTWIGVGIGEVFDAGGTPDLGGLLFEPQILWPTLALCALAALPILLRAVRRTSSG